MAKDAKKAGIEIKAKSGYHRTNVVCDPAGYNVSRPSKAKMDSGYDIEIQDLDIGAPSSDVSGWMVNGHFGTKEDHYMDYGFEPNFSDSDASYHVIRYNPDRNQYTLLGKLEGKKLVSSDPTREGGLILDFGNAGSVKHEDSTTAVTLPNAEGCWTTTTFKKGSVMATDVEKQVRMHKTPKNPKVFV